MIADNSSMDGSLDDLRIEVEELRASRARLVAAADAERRRIERDLHDGAQQQFVALAINLQLARHLAGSDPAALGLLLEELAGDVRGALDEVRQLANGIYPSLLIDRGLVEALRAAASVAGIPVTVEAPDVDGLGAEVEAAVYFGCVEAMGNAARHAGAGARATVRVAAHRHEVRFEVIDDGAGFRPDSTPRGAGLTAIGDRLGALGGRLAVQSEPGRGTRVSGAIPVAGPSAR